MRYFIKLAFNGAAYHGWQAQDNAVSVQQTLEQALSTILRTAVAITGAGRTDAGVHAREYFAHFEIDRPVEQQELHKLPYKVNGLLQGDISVYKIFPVAADMHARFSALSRTYKYYISRTPDPFTREFSWFFGGNLDIEKMNQGATFLIGCSDFTSFAKVHSDTTTNICRLTEARWKAEGSQLVFTITADRFLRNMVRSIVGTLVELGTGKINLDDLHNIVESKNRSAAGYSVPAKGLFLERITYPEGIMNFRL